MAATEAAITAGASLLAAGGSIAANSNLNAKNREWQEQQAREQRAWNSIQQEKQNAWNYEMWLKEQEYNTPENQVERLRAAGLNPLFYGLDGNSTSQAQPAAQALGYERASQYAMANPYAEGMDAALKAAQVANIEAQTQKTKSETSAINAKLPFEVDNLKAQVRNSNLNSDAQETINKYLDAQQQAELRVKEATAAEADAMVQKAFGEIEKMDYEETTMMIGWLETREKILNLQKQRDLTDKQIEELASLISVNNATAAKIGLDVRNYDDITVIGNASHNIKMGPFSVQEGEPITLGMLKASREHRDEIKGKKDEDSPANPKHNKRRGEYEYKDTHAAYDGPIYD